MKQRKRSIPIAAILFAVTELVLGIMAHTAHRPTMAHARYAIVLLAFLFCFLFFERSLSYLFTQLALLATVAADYILILHNEYGFLLAVLLFTVAQLAYAARLLAGEAPTLRRRHLAVRLLLSVGAISVGSLALGEAADALSLVALFYFANLVTNAVFAVFEKESRGVFATGLLLFVLCDIFMGFGMLGTYLPVGHGALIRFLTSPPLDMAWVFYPPSQALLALSLLPRSIKKATV